MGGRPSKPKVRSRKSGELQVSAPAASTLSTTSPPPAPSPSLSPIPSPSPSPPSSPKNQDEQSSGYIFAEKVIHRGLDNPSGANNCFLNAVVQTLWHVRPFREALQQYIYSENWKTCEDPDNDILMQLSSLFIEYEFTDMETLPPTELRKAMSKVSDNFGMGKIADANELLDVILNLLHESASPPCSESNRCIAHQSFGGTLVEQTWCQYVRPSVLF